jgi:outer membrane protein assembly factor BamE (lipoprotein component of BamABCDE complex)
MRQVRAFYLIRLHNQTNRFRQDEIMKQVIFVVLSAVLLCGCATAPKMNSLSVGMTKDEVLHIMGNPASTAASDGTEFLRYELSSTSEQAEYHITEEYYVRLIDGRVDSYGRMGDFNSTKNPTFNYNINNR